MNTGSASSTATSCLRLPPTSRPPSTRRRATASPPTTSSPKASTSSETRGSSRSSSTSSSSLSSFPPTRRSSSRPRPSCPSSSRAAWPCRPASPPATRSTSTTRRRYSRVSPRRAQARSSAPRPATRSAPSRSRASASSAPPIADLLTRANEAGAELDDFPEEGLEASFEDHVGVSIDEAAAALGDASLWVRGELPDALEVAGEIEVSDTEAATALIEAIEEEVSEEEGAKLGPPVGGSDVGFSALDGQLDPGQPASFEPTATALSAPLTPTPRRRR